MFTLVYGFIFECTLVYVLVLNQCKFNATNLVVMALYQGIYILSLIALFQSLSHPDDQIDDF